MSLPEITQRDLRSRSREIMDAVEHGQGFTVTRDGHPRRADCIPARDQTPSQARNGPLTIGLCLKA